MVQAAQVYAASIMFGYFVRRVDKRFQLERQLGLLQDQQADAVARLERLFNAAATADPDDQDPDQAATPSGASSTPPPSPSDDFGAASSSGSGSGSKGEGAGLGKGKKKESPLRKYIESFDQQTLADMTRQVVRHDSTVSAALGLGKHTAASLATSTPYDC